MDSFEIAGFGTFRLDDPDGIHRQVYIKFIDISLVHDISRATNGETIYKHVTGEISPRSTYGSRDGTEARASGKLAP